MQNVMPAHIPDSIIFVDAITVVFEEASKGGPSVSLPIASTETGNGHTLPNLALRLVFNTLGVIQNGIPAFIFICKYVRIYVHWQTHTASKFIATLGGNSSLILLFC